MSGNPQHGAWRAGMSRSALGVTSDLLNLKILVGAAGKSLLEGGELAPTRRQSLSRSFHNYIDNDSMHRVRPNGVSSTRGGLHNIAAQVVIMAAGDDAPRVLQVIDKFASEKLDQQDRDYLATFLSRLNVALSRSRAGIRVSRYL